MEATVKLTDQDLEAIAQRIASDIRGGRPVPFSPVSASSAASGSRPAPASAYALQPGDMGVFQTVDDAVAAVRKAWPVFTNLPLDARRRIIDSIKSVMRENSAQLAREAVDETRYGRFEDKVAKNALAIEKSVGVEGLTTTAYTGEHGLTLVEYAPYGVIGSITPTTNPVATLISNSICMLSAGNVVLFSVHPAAKLVSVHTVVLLNKAIVAAGGPPNVVACIANPTTEAAGQLMHHPGIRVLAVTGGEGVVHAAMNAGKRAICAGPGNPPVVVDETADIENAAKSIVMGASFDNNVICIEEKETVVVSSVADQLIQAMLRNNAVLIPRDKISAMEQVIFTKMAGPRGKATVNKKWIGKNAADILAQIGISAPPSTRLAICDVPNDHPLLWTEQMMPVMPITRAPNANAAIDLALQMEGQCYHTACIHSRNIDNLSRMAKLCNCSIFVKNGPSLNGLGFGGEGYASFTIASPTGEGITTSVSFSRIRRCTLVDRLRIV